MEIYILRHGIAVERGTKGYEKDSGRPLTKEGEGKTRQAAEAIMAMGLKFNLILSSKLVRAKKTAEIVAKELGTKVTTTDHLAPAANPANLIAAINNEKPERVLLVGHEPDLSRLISVLVTGSPEASIELKKGALCKLTSENLTYGQSATINWLLTPKQLKAMR
jgi:phosphohistidine phosphatase